MEDEKLTKSDILFFTIMIMAIVSGLWLGFMALGDVKSPCNLKGYDYNNFNNSIDPDYIECCNIYYDNEHLEQTFCKVIKREGGE